jgi:hypothetical protein
MSVVDDSFGHPLQSEEKAVNSLAGGIANMGYQCGMLWGAALAAGAQAYRLYGSGPQAEAAAIAATQRQVEAFRTHTKNEINCLEISDLNMQGDFDAKQILKFFLKGGPIGCFRMAANYAQDAFSEINAAYAEKPIELSASPVSCATMLAKKLGASEMHAVMAAGFAGGIGLSGGACGALGAAIWLTGINQPVKIEGMSYSGTWVNDMIETFLEGSDYEFECAEIVSREFESVSDHADYVCNGGCSEIIETLVAYGKEHNLLQYDEKVENG